MVLSRDKCRGQAAIETALALVAAIVPLTIALLGFSEVAWTYHALATLTRQGAQYAATHCFQDDSGSNVTNWMIGNAPGFPDRPKLVTGEIPIQVQYWTHDSANHLSNPFSCGGDACSAQCVPDSVTVSINGYFYNHFFPYFGFAPFQVPSFSTTVEMQSTGGNPETGVSLP
jgi:hypothetical protein